MWLSCLQDSVDYVRGGDHYYWRRDCMQTDTLFVTMFPFLKTRRAEDRVKFEDTFDIYCTCRMHEYNDGCYYCV